MANLIEKILESKDARLDRHYELAIKGIGTGTEQIDENQVPIVDYRERSLITELDRGLATRRERTFFKFRDMYFVAVQKVKGTGLESGTPFGYVEAIIRIPGKRHISRTDWNYGPGHTLTEVRSKVIDAIVKKYNLETPWNDDSAFDYLIRQIIGGYNYLKGKKFVDLDENEGVKRTKNFMNALNEWKQNDQTTW